MLHRSDEEILENTLQDLEKYAPGIRDKVLGYDIQRFRYAFPVFHPEYGEILKILYDDPTTTGPLFLAGDYMVHATFDGAVVSALHAHERISDYL